MTQLTVNLSDHAVQQARVLAALEGREVGEFISTMVEEKLLADPHQELKALESLSDDDILAMADLKLTVEEDDRLGELLELNREGHLTPSDKVELDALMRIYGQGTIKKAMGWAEAVRRKLRQPLGT